MSKKLRHFGVLVLALVGATLGVAGRAVAQQAVPDATLTMVPSGATKGGANGYVIASPEAGGVTSVTMKSKILNLTTKPLSDSGSATDQTKLDGTITNVRFPVWVVRLEATMTAFAKADQVGDPQQGSYEAVSTFKLVYEYNPGAGTKEVTDTITLKSDETGPKQTRPGAGKISVTDRRAEATLDTTYRSECEGSISSSRPEVTIEGGAHHLAPWKGTATAYNERTSGLVVIVRPDGTEAKWELK